MHTTARSPSHASVAAASRQRGVSSVMLIAMIVFLAMLSTYTLHFVGATQGAQTMDIALARVEQAARTGLEWQRYKLRNAVSPADAITVCPATANLLVPLSSGNVTVTLVCSRTPNAATTHTEGALSVYTYAFTATACAPSPGGSCPEPDATKGSAYVERKLTGQAACSTNGARSDCTW